MMSILLFFWLTHGVFADTQDPAERVSMELRHASSHNELWSDVGAPGADRNHSLTFGLKQQNLEYLSNVFANVSTPGPSYGAYLSNAEVRELVSNPLGVDVLLSWLQKNGVREFILHPSLVYVTATAPVGKWNSLFGTDLRLFSSPGRKTVLRGTEYSLPVAIAEHVNSVFGIVHLPLPLRPLPRARPLSAGDDDPNVTPALLNTLYSIKSNDASLGGGQSLFESISQNYSPEDLADFQYNFDLPATKVAQDIGGHNKNICKKKGDDCGEANLDVQWIMAVAQKADTWYWYIDDDRSFAEWLVDVAANSDPPAIHSVSYGTYEQDVPATTTATFNTEAMKLGVQGVSIVVSSGDDGVAGDDVRKGIKHCGYYPSWPASSPFVTAVGATMGPENGTAEVACEAPHAGITTGGGFSQQFKTPAWQSADVGAYFKNCPSCPFGPGYNSAGRGYPDVAMLGHSYLEVVGGDGYLVDGTSASAPVFAAVLSLVNHARKKAGKPYVGFATSALYKIHASTPQAFHDITSGANNCGAAGDTSTNCCPKAGFKATKGWDPLTGLGSVDVSQLIAAWLKL